MEVENKEVKAPVTDNVNISEQQKENYFKAFLANKCYEETASLWGGKFKITFKTLTVDENNDVVRQMSLDQSAGIAKNNDYYFLQCVYYKLGMTIVSVDGVALAPNLTKEKVEEDEAKAITYICERAKVFKDWPTFKMAAVQTEYSEFERRVLRLTEKIQDPDFWKAAA